MAEEPEEVDSLMSEAMSECVPESRPKDLPEKSGIVVLQDIHDLMGHFMNQKHSAAQSSSQGLQTQEKCDDLFSKDYRYSIITNEKGELSESYPYRLIYLEKELENRTEVDENFYRVPKKVQHLMYASRISRCRNRFVVPTILYEGKHICRSATLSTLKEVFYEYYVQGRTFEKGTETTRTDTEVVQSSFITCIMNKFSEEYKNVTRLVGAAREQDILLLKHLSVHHIIDLMVENKKVKYNMNVSSSEKIDKENRYAEFNLTSLPYPGCEFFEEFSTNALNAAINFDWTKPEIDAELTVSQDSQIVSDLGIDWTKCKEWNLLDLTKNYMKLILAYIKKDSRGLLIHCISGWDRTPLFISLLRMSLWADGKIHKSLSPLEILYLTLGYDWYLFSHDLGNRASKQELVLLFCFEFLKHFHHEDFSLLEESDEISEADLSWSRLSDLENSSNLDLCSKLPHTRFEIISSERIEQDSTGSDAKAESKISLLRKGKLGAILDAFNPAWTLAYYKKQCVEPAASSTSASYTSAVVVSIQSMFRRSIDYGRSWWK